MKAKKIILKKVFEGEPKKSDLELIEEELPNIKDGEILCESAFLSVDPYMRIFVPSTGDTMTCQQIAKVIASKHTAYPVESYVVAQYGWKTHAILQPDNIINTPDNWTTFKPYLIPEYVGLPKSLCLGVLGLPGITAYFGFLKICKPKPGETVAVTGAAGAVGSIVGQIARINGCKVIGFTGSDAKCEWLLKGLGFDGAINYKKDGMAEALKAAAPNGIDCYFDNVGGETSRVIMKQMNPFGRIAVCGGVSAYNAPHFPDIAISQADIRYIPLKVEGFQFTRWYTMWQEAIDQNLKWIQEGKLIYMEHVTEGFENMPDAFIGMFKGANFGKTIVKA